MAQLQSLRTVNMTKQEQTLVLQRERLLQQVERVVEALQIHLVAIDGGSPTDKHASNINLVTQCNFLNAQTTLAKGRGDRKGLQIGLKTALDRVDALRDQGISRSRPAQEAVRNYAGYMTAVLRGDDAVPLPTVEITASDGFENVGNSVFEGFLGNFHDSERRTKGMERNIDAVQARQESSYSTAAGFETAPEAGMFDVSRMTGYMRGRVSGYTGSKPRAVSTHAHTNNPPDLCGDAEDVEMSDEIIIAGSMVRVLANGRVYRVSRVDWDRGLVFVEDRQQGRLVRLRIGEVERY